MSVISSDLSCICFFLSGIQCITFVKGSHKIFHQFVAVCLVLSPELCLIKQLNYNFGVS